MDFFHKHPLKTKKNVDFKKFARIVRKMSRGDHLNRDGLKEIVKIAMSMNSGEHKRLKEIYDALTG